MLKTWTFTTVQGTGTVTAENVDQARFQLRQHGIELKNTQLVPLVTSSRHVRILDQEPCSRLRNLMQNIDDLFICRQDAENWLNRPNPIFQGRKPAEMLRDGDIGPLETMISSTGLGLPG